LSRKHVISKTFVNETVSADAYSEELNVAQTDNGSIHISWSNGSTPNIDIYLQVKNGEADSWRSLSFGSVPNISGASGEHELILNELPFTIARLFFDRASGSADVVASFTFKSRGA
jgi:hypothetical protein